MTLQKIIIVVTLLLVNTATLVSCESLEMINSRYAIAIEIEDAILDECSIEIAVDPSTVPVYDVDYWTTTLPDNQTRITCVAGNGTWYCDCDDR